MEGTTAAELSSPEMRDNCAAADGSSHVVPLSSTRKQKRLHQTTRKVSTSKCEQRNGTAEQEENKMRDGQQQQSTPLLASSRHRSGQGIYKGKKELGTFSRTDKRITRIRAPFLGGSPIPDPPRRRKPPKPVRRRSTEARLDSGSAAPCAGRTTLPIAAARITERTPASRCARKQHPFPPPPRRGSRGGDGMGPR
jgi:hypothetical protein